MQTTDTICGQQYPIYVDAPENATHRILMGLNTVVFFASEEAANNYFDRLSESGKAISEIQEFM